LKKYLAVLFCLALAAAAAADTVSSEGLVSGGAFMDAGYYSSFSSIGDGLAWPAGVVSVTLDLIGPTISYIHFDGRTVISNDYVPSKAEITARVIDNQSGVNSPQSSIEVDGRLIPFNSVPYNTSFIGDVMTYKGNFADGSHTFRVIAADNAGNLTTSETIAFKVEAGEAKILGPVLNYKNPFNPGRGEVTQITYMLNTDTDITIYIYNMIGQLVKKIDCPSGAEGGHSGYNSVPWNGYSDSRELVANDAYYLRIISGGKVIGKGKIAVLK